MQLSYLHLLPELTVTYYFQVYVGYYSFLVGHLRYIDGTSGLGDEAIIGLIVGSTALITVIAIIIMVVWFHKQKQKADDETDNDDADPDSIRRTDMVHMHPL